MPFDGGLQQTESLGGLASIQQLARATDSRIIVPDEVLIRGILTGPQVHRCDKEQHREDHASPMLRANWYKGARLKALSCAHGHYAKTAIIYCPNAIPIEYGTQVFHQLTDNFV